MMARMSWNTKRYPNLKLNDVSNRLLHEIIIMKTPANRIIRNCAFGRTQFIHLNWIMLVSFILHFGNIP